MKATGSYLLMLQKYINWKQKNAEIKDYAVCLGNVSKDFIISNMKKNKIKRSCKIYLLILIPLILKIF